MHEVFDDQHSLPGQQCNPQRVGFFSDNRFPHIMHTLCPKKGRAGGKNQIETI
jgi:hypothetical protein